jgi:hypothetical protein
MNTDSITSASTDNPNTLIPLLTFILIDKEDRTFEYRYKQQADADIGRVVMPTLGRR